MSLLIALGSSPPVEVVTVDKYWQDAVVPGGFEKWFLSGTFEATPIVAATPYTPTIDKFWCDAAVPETKRFDLALYQRAYLAVIISPPAVVTLDCWVDSAIPIHPQWEARDLSVFVPDYAAALVRDLIEDQIILAFDMRTYVDMSVEPVYVPAPVIEEINKGGDDVPREIEYRKYKPKTNKDPFDKVITKKIKKEILQSVAGKQHVAKLPQVVEYDETDDEESLMMLL